MEVYPLTNKGEVYGVIQNGNHFFYSDEKNKSGTWSSRAKFMHLWLVEKGEFKLAKGLSYDHQTAALSWNQELLFTDKVETEKWLKHLNIPAIIAWPCSMMKTRMAT